MIDDLIEAAWQARRQGRDDEAERGLRAAIDASRQSGAAAQLASALGRLAHVMRDLGRHNEALPLSEEAVRVCAARVIPRSSRTPSVISAISTATADGWLTRIAVTPRR